jgi:SAM-dependent methyltransferase
MPLAYPKNIIKGLLTWSPILRRKFGTGGMLGPESARYSYSVWLRHLVAAHESYPGFHQRVVAELGPGPSLGIGLAALLCGSDRYYAFDVEPYALHEQHLRIFDELVRMIRNREPIPGESEFPEATPRLTRYDFPRHILTDELLARTLDAGRLDRIRRILSSGQHDPDLHVSYVAPWDNPELIQPDSVDLILSQAVLEHIDDLEKTYRIMHHWLKPGGLMSHAIDFRSHGAADRWNGHWRVFGLHLEDHARPPRLLS